MFWRDLALALELPIFGPDTASMTPRALWKQIVDGGGRLTWDELVSHPHGLIYADKTYGHLTEAIATPDGAVQLAPADFVNSLHQALARPAAATSAEWPMLLSNQRRKSAMNSWLTDTPTALRRDTSNVLYLHALDADALGIQTGDVARVASPVDCLDCIAEISDAPQIGVAILAHGWGSRVFDPHGGEPAQAHGVNRNALVSDTSIDPLSGTPAFGVAAVRIIRLESQEAMKPRS